MDVPPIPESKTPIEKLLDFIGVVKIKKPTIKVGFKIL